jgi:hypothetical protein
LRVQKAIIWSSFVSRWKKRKRIADWNLLALQVTILQSKCYKNFNDCSFYDHTFLGSNSVLETFYNEEERRNYEKWKATTVVELHQQKYIVKPLYNNRIIFDPPPPPRTSCCLEVVADHSIHGFRQKICGEGNHQDLEASWQF